MNNYIYNDSIFFIDNIINLCQFAFIWHMIMNFRQQFINRYYLIRLYNIYRPIYLNHDLPFQIIFSVFVWNALKPSLLYLYIHYLTTTTEIVENALICAEMELGLDCYSFKQYCAWWNLIFMVLVVFHTIQKLYYSNLSQFVMLVWIGFFFYSSAPLAISVNIGDFSLNLDQYLLVTVIYCLRIGIMIVVMLDTRARREYLIQPVRQYRKNLYVKTKNVLDKKFGFEIGMIIRSYLQPDWYFYDKQIVYKLHKEILIMIQKTFGNDVGLLLYSFVFNDLSFIKN